MATTIPAIGRVKKPDGFHYGGWSADGFGAAKDNNSLIILVIPAKAGIRCGVSVRKTGPILRTTASGFPPSRE